MLENSYCCFNCGGDEVGGNCSFLYNCLASYYSNNSKFCNKISKSSDLLYCDYCFQCNSCFGCIGLRHKKYCILNKQYSKEEYENLVSKIIKHMEKTEEDGEFFPSKISPFGYNDSIAFYYFPLNKEEAIKNGFKWNNYKNPKTNIKSISANKLSDKIENINIENAIKCEECEKLFKIIPKEFQKYKKWEITLPHLCPDCRHFHRKKKINPRKLWDKKCDKCKINIKSTFSPERKEIIYCEKCYLNEFY